MFEHNNYSELVQKEIKNDLLLTGLEKYYVSLPSTNCILADKLTAFAPHTTGIPLNIGKDMEVMKQFYDLSSLLDVFTEFKKIKPTYEKIVEAETSYRGIEKDVKECLWDSFDAALCIASRGKINKDEYMFYLKDIKELKGHIYSENYTPELAVKGACKIMYMVACLLLNTKYLKIDDYTDLINMKLVQEKLMPLYYLRKSSPEAYAYVVKTDQLLSNIQESNNDR